MRNQRKDFSIEARIGSETFVGENLRYIRTNRIERTGEKVHANFRVDEFVSELLEYVEQSQKILTMPKRGKRHFTEIRLRERGAQLLIKARGKITG